MSKQKKAMIDLLLSNKVVSELCKSSTIHGITVMLTLILKASVSLNFDWF
jgi:hypothetical protein